MSAGMDDLAKRAYGQLAKFQVTLALLIFVPAWSPAYWQGWIVWALFLLCCAAITRYFLKHDRALIMRRMNAGPAAEHEPRQKLIQAFAAFFVIAIFVLSALDDGFRWSAIPDTIAILGHALIVIGFAIMFQSFRDNSFAASTIQVDSEQRVIDTGLCAHVRHPMYTGALIMFAGIPLGLASWWGLVPALLLAATIVWRLTDEESYLARNLAGYDDYRGRVRARLVPGVF